MDDDSDGTVRHNDHLPLRVAGGCVDSRLPPQPIVAMPLQSASGNSLADGRTRNDYNRNDVAAASIARDGQRLVCGACGGTGRHAHYLGGCSFCRGSGLLRDERRLDLIDAIADKLSDTCDLDVGWHRYAEAVVELLERQGLDVTTLRGDVA
jgi:hypothetical protein